MKPSYRKSHPIDLDRIASDVAARGIDIAPTRLAWELLARCCATAAGEQGRDAFHKMAAVWPDYSRHDSQLCYNRALRQTGRAVSLGYLARVLKPHGIDINSPCCSKWSHQVKKQKNQTTMKKIPFNTMLKTLPCGRAILGRNQLTDLLLRIFPQHSVMSAVQRYKIGLNSFNTGAMGDALIFWQIDEKNHIVNAKRIHYRCDGHRDKKVPPIVMYPGNPQCLFGLHLLTDADPDQPVAIVESEKSALIMSLVKPDYLWMACGSLNNFNENFLKPLQGRNIVAFPDVDINREKGTTLSISYALWQKTAKQLSRDGWHVIVDNTLEETVNTSQRMDKFDVADIAINNAIQQHYKSLLRVRANETNKTNKTDEKK